MNCDDYEALREKNIAERKAIFAEFFNDLKKEAEDEKNLQKTFHGKQDNVENIPPRKRRRTVGYKVTEVRNKYNTRSKTRNSISDVSNDSENDEILNEFTTQKSKLRLRFPWDKSNLHDFNIDTEENNSDDDELDTSIRKRVRRITKSAYDPNNVPSVDEITEEMLSNIAEKSTSKVYDKINGTSCHQCRQKTLDTKTVCRSGECIGIRGKFCGPCLRGRYGESAVEALQNPKWACPPCRGLCNCSICRTRSGLRPTGILAPVAQEEGFSSVMDYLQSKEQ